MAAEPAPVPAHASDWASTHAAALPDASAVAGAPMPTPARAPVNEELAAVAADMAPGKALALGCGEGHESVWLARRGWIVNAVDTSSAAVTQARELAAAAGVDSTIVLRVADLAEWRPISRYDLVFSAFALPARGRGRSRALETAAAAVAPGGTILLLDLDISLRREGMPEKYLVSVEELERYLDGFRIERSGVRMVRHRHGYEERVRPAAMVVGTRRTDLRTL